LPLSLRPIVFAASWTMDLAVCWSRFRTATSLTVNGVLVTLPSISAVAVQENLTGSSFGEV